MKILTGDRCIEEEGLVATVGKLGADGDQVAIRVVELDLERGRIGELAALVRWSRGLQFQRLAGLDIDRIPVVIHRRGQRERRDLGIPDIVAVGPRTGILIGRPEGRAVRRIERHGAVVADPEVGPEERTARGDISGAEVAHGVEAADPHRDVLACSTPPSR